MGGPHFHYFGSYGRQERPRQMPFVPPPEWGDPKLKDSPGMQIHPSQHTGQILITQVSRQFRNDAIDVVYAQLMAVEENYQVTIVLAPEELPSGALLISWYPAYIREPVDA